MTYAYMSLDAEMTFYAFVSLSTNQEAVSADPPLTGEIM